MVEIFYVNLKLKKYIIEYTLQSSSMAQQPDIRYNIVIENNRLVFVTFTFTY